MDRYGVIIDNYDNKFRPDESKLPYFVQNKMNPLLQSPAFLFRL